MIIDIFHPLRVFKSRQRKRKNISIVLSSQKKHKDFFFVLFLFVYMNLFGETRTLRPYFCKNSLPCKGRWVAVTATRRDFLKKIDFKKKVFRFLIPQSSSMTAPFTREPNLSPQSVRVAHSQILTGESPLCRFVTFPHTVGNLPF